MSASTAGKADAFDQIAALLGDSDMLLKQYLGWLESQDASGQDEVDVTVVRGSQPHEGAFLSVILRTQGVRVEELREALRSLQGQSSRDFQLIVVGHNMDAEGEVRVMACLDELDEWLQAQTLFLRVSGGTRARPLNAAIPFISGRYFSVFDEDDLVYENWVSTFSSLAHDHPDHVFYCFVETQPWRVDEDAQGTRTLVCESEQVGWHYCKHPNQLELLVGNHCPFMGLAFPASVVAEWGLRFNEDLQTTEDWDFFMRVCNVYPFMSCDEHVALYRLWSVEGGNSTSAVSQDRWLQDHAKVQADKARAPLLFAPGFSEQARQALGDAVSDAVSMAKGMELFLDVGKGFDPRYRVTALPVAGETGAFAFTDLKRFGPVRELRVDPAPHGPFALEDYSLEIWLADGAVFSVAAMETHMNGRRVGGQHEWPADDPQITCALPSPETLDKLVFRSKRAFGFVEGAEQATGTAATPGKRRSLMDRLKRS